MKESIDKYLKTHDLLRHNTIFFIGTMCIAFFNYLYYPVISRMVSISVFGEIQAMISIFTQVGIVLTAFGYVVTNIINNEKEYNTSKLVILQLEKITLIITIALLFVLMLFGYVFKNSLQLSSVIPVILVGVLVVINVPSVSRTYLLQGKKKLKEVSISGIIFAITKLVFSIILIVAGFDVVGVMLAYILAQIATLLYLLSKTKIYFPGLIQGLTFLRKHVVGDSGKRIIKKELVYGGAILTLLFSITALYTSDTVIARLFLSAKQAGAYSGISAIGHIIYFATASVAGVLLATIKLQDGYKTSRRILYKSSLIVLAVGGMGALVFSVFSNTVVSILLGSNYCYISYLLPLASLLFLVCSINNLLVCFQIARRRYRSIFATTLGLVVLAISLIIWHSGYYSILCAYLISNLITFVVLLVQIMRREVNE